MTTIGIAFLIAFIVAAIATIQPLYVLILESIVDRSFVRITIKREFVSKLIPLIMIIAGLILIYTTSNI